MEKRRRKNQEKMKNIYYYLEGIFSYTDRHINGS